jgi:hypothetical protein
MKEEKEEEKMTASKAMLSIYEEEFATDRLITRVALECNGARGWGSTHRCFSSSSSSIPPFFFFLRFGVVCVCVRREPQFISRTPIFLSFFVFCFSYFYFVLVFSFLFCFFLRTLLS